MIEPVMKSILAPTAIGINGLKADPVAVLEASNDMPIAILDGNKPVAYLMTAKAWGAICNELEDAELRSIAEARLNDGQPNVPMLFDTP
jgi:antitoxin StbD